MLFKLMGSTLIILSTSLIGLIYSKKFTDRPQYLRIIKAQLQFLETEICYMSNPILESFKKIITVFGEQASPIFRKTVLLLETKQYRNVSDAWEHAVCEDMCNSPINNEDGQLLISFGKSLGNSDGENQQKNIKNIMLQLQLQMAKAEEDKAKNAKLYKSLGVLSGVMITIILF